MTKCKNCNKECNKNGRKGLCQGCYRAKNSSGSNSEITEEVDKIRDIISTQNVDMNLSGMSLNEDNTKFSNLAFVKCTVADNVDCVVEDNYEDVNDNLQANSLSLRNEYDAEIDAGSYAETMPAQPILKPPRGLDELFDMFVKMKSDFHTILKGKDITISALTERVRHLESAVQKLPNATIEDRVTVLEEEAKKTIPAVVGNNPDNSEKLVSDMKEYSEKLDVIKDTVALQQKTLEDLQGEKRAKNIIITGILEPSGTRAEARKSDEASVKAILQELGCGNVAPSQVVRLGKKSVNTTSGGGNASSAHPGQNMRPRPMLIALGSSSEVQSILNKRYVLKDSPVYRKVYIKKDEHPLVRKEWNRLRELVHKEKNSPTNQGCTIKLDYRNKTVTRDGVVIQRFVSPFRTQGPNTSE